MRREGATIRTGPGSPVDSLSPSSHAQMRLLPPAFEPKEAEFQVNVNNSFLVIRQPKFPKLLCAMQMVDIE